MLGKTYFVWQLVIDNEGQRDGYDKMAEFALNSAL
jgi:hypothetical protein